MGVALPPISVPIELLKKVDYKTLLFFIGLFLVVGGLEQTSILEMIAGFIGEISGNNLYLIQVSTERSTPCTAARLLITGTIVAANGILSTSALAKESWPDSA